MNRDIRVAANGLLFILVRLASATSHVTLFFFFFFFSILFLNLNQLACGASINQFS